MPVEQSTQTFIHARGQLVTLEMEKEQPKMRYLILVAPFRIFPRGYSDGNWQKVCIIRLHERKSHNGWNVSTKLQHMHGFIGWGFRSDAPVQRPKVLLTTESIRMKAPAIVSMTRAIEWKRSMRLFSPDHRNLGPKDGKRLKNPIKVDNLTFKWCRVWPGLGSTW